MGFDYCNYEIDVIDKKIVSKCECFITENEEIITAYDIFYSKQKDNRVSDMEHYISILEENGIENARENFENMLVVDYLVMNIDRHMKNFGVIRDVNTLKWKKLVPIYDTGECMQNHKNILEISFKDDTGKLFTNTNKKFSTYPYLVENPQRIDLSDLINIEQDLKQILVEYKDITGMEEERIEKIVKGLRYRIDHFYNHINNYKDNEVDEERHIIKEDSEEEEDIL